MWNKDFVGRVFFTNYLACLAVPVDESVCEVIACFLCSNMHSFSIITIFNYEGSLRWHHNYPGLHLAFLSKQTVVILQFTCEIVALSVNKSHDLSVLHEHFYRMGEHHTTQ